jgi:hypothetical protein
VSDRELAEWTFEISGSAAEVYVGTATHADGTSIRAFGPDPEELSARLHESARALGGLGQETSDADDDQHLTEAVQAEVAEFVRRAQAPLASCMPRPRPSPGGATIARMPPAVADGERLTQLAHVFEADRTALVRTDFSDDQAWETVVTDVTKARGSEGSQVDAYEPAITVFDDRYFERATGRSMAALVAAHEDVRGYAVLADHRSMTEAARGGELTVLYVDLSVLDDDDPELVSTSFLGRTFRCAVSAVASVQANLAIANLDFSDFADRLDPDGVFRGPPL